MNGVRYRQAAVGDVSALAALHALCFEPSWDRASFTRLLERPGAFALLALEVAGGGPLGFAVFEQAADEAEILTIGVRPDCRRRGIAAGLLSRGCAALACRGVEKMHLEVAEENHDAVALYRAAGFARTGRRPAYYRRGAEGPPGEALILTRSLRPLTRR